MALVLELADECRWVVAAAVGHLLIAIWMGIGVARARSKYKVFYPTMYADEREHGKQATQAFNCVQRAHQNMLEFSPSFLVSLLVGGLQFPRAAAALGAVYDLARIQYFRGYSSGESDKRFSGGGFLFLPAHLGLVFCAICFAFHLFFPNLL